MSVLFALLAPAAFMADVAPPPAADLQAAKEIIAQETELGRAMIHRDVAALQRIVGDEWLCQGATGTSTKAGFISDVATGKLTVRTFTLHDVHVRVFGDVAYLMAADDEQSAYAGSDNSGTYNWLDVWMKRDGRWVSVATQITSAVAK